MPGPAEPRLDIRRANWALLFAAAGFLVLARLIARYTSLNPYWAEVVCFCLFPILLVRREGQKPGNALRLGGVRAEHVGLAVGIYALSLLVVIAVTFTTMAIISGIGFHSWDTGGNPIIDYQGSLNQSLFFFAIIPAICEETFFRGYLLRAYSPLGTWRAIVFSSLLFALLHGSIIRLPITFTLGVVLSLLALKTGSLVPSMIVHFVNNAVAVTLTNGLTKLVPRSQAMASAATLPTVPLVAVAIVLVIGLGGAAAVWAILKPEKPFPRAEVGVWPALRVSLLALPVLAVEAFYLFLNFRGLS